MKSGSQIAIDIMEDVARAHDQFYNLVLNRSEPKPSVYHRLQSAFRNSAVTLKAFLVELVVCEDRIRICINLVFFVCCGSDYLI